MIDFRGHISKFTQKINVFPIYLLKNPIKYVLKSSQQGLFFQDNPFEVSYAQVFSKNACFPMYVMTKVPFLTMRCDKQCEIAIPDHYILVAI